MVSGLGDPLKKRAAVNARKLKKRRCGALVVAFFRRHRGASRKLGKPLTYIVKISRSKSLLDWLCRSKSAKKNHHRIRRGNSIVRH